MPHPVQLITPFELDHPDEPFPVDLYGQRFLAQGDSWFSIGAIPPWLTTNVLMELRTARRAVAVNCAAPGAVLRRMVDNVKAPLFARLLSGNIARRWDAILVSGGGNDLIEAVGSPPGAARDRRLLLRPDERSGLDAASYLSDAGWQTFTTYLGAVFAGLMDLRDRGPNQATPLLLHTYAELRPRPAPAGPGLGPWLLPAMQAFEVPEAEWMAIGQLLMRRLGTLLSTLAAERAARHPEAGAIHVIDSQAAHLVPADPGSTGASGDWANEIHPTPDGYAKLADAWAPVIDALP